MSRFGDPGSNTTPNHLGGAPCREGSEGPLPPQRRGGPSSVVPTCPRSLHHGSARPR